MKNVHASYELAKEINTVYRRDFENAYETLMEELHSFLGVLNCDNKVQLNELVLAYALIDYFEDIQRVKDFHKLDLANGMKTVAYKVFWFLRRRPIQVLSCDKNLIFVNEKFVVSYILSYLSEMDDFILDRTEDEICAFKDTLFYYLKYRLDSPKSIELILMSFFAGQKYANSRQISCHNNNE